MMLLASLEHLLQNLKRSCLRDQVTEIRKCLLEKKTAWYEMVMRAANASTVQGTMLQSCLMYDVAAAAAQTL